MKESAPQSGQDFDLVKCSADPVWKVRPEHVGVWLDRCYFSEDEKRKDADSKPARRELYQQAIDALRSGQPAVEAYKMFFERWQRDIRQAGLTQRQLVIEAKTRVLLSPASNASVTDGSVLLHHTYGVPYLPGSGLKGLARAWVRRTVDLAERGERRSRVGDAWQTMRSDARDQEIVRALFGYIPREGEREAQSQGAVVEFLDALWVPEVPTESKDWSPLALDVVTPHQSLYYTGGGDPGDTNEPLPTHRLSAAPGARFLVTLECVAMRRADDSRENGGAWVDYVLDHALVPALESMGFGAWASAGYGRFAVLKETANGPVDTRADFGAASGEAGVWHPAVLKRDPGSGKLSATLPSPERRVAEAHGRAAQELHERLSQELRERLKKKRSIEVRVRVERIGNAWKIVDIQE